MATQPSLGPIQFRAANLKALRQFDWSPSGVCSLVGPNGIGKSTALKIPEVFRQSLENGFAVGLQGLAGPLRHLDAAPNDQVVIGIAAAGATWQVAVGNSGQFRETATSMSLELNPSPTGTTVVAHPTGTNTHINLGHEPGETMLRALRRKPELGPELSALSAAISRSRFYGRPQLEQLREVGSAIGNDVVLDDGARNLFTVLRNWRDTAEMEHRVAFVLDRMRELFPGYFSRLDFTTVGQRTSGAVLTPKWSTKLQPTDWSDGFFTVLAHLTAVASVDTEGIVALDEPENSLHPGLIAHLVESMRMWSRQRSVTVLLATHSPVVLDQFKTEPEKVFVMQPGAESLPVALDSLKKREWLEHFSIGDIYSHLEIGAPSP